jgi:hypothetical protein
MSNFRVFGAPRAVVARKALMVNERGCHYAAAVSILSVSVSILRTLIIYLDPLVPRFLFHPQAFILAFSPRQLQRSYLPCP